MTLFPLVKLLVSLNFSYACKVVSAQRKVDHATHALGFRRSDSLVRPSLLISFFFALFPIASYLSINYPICKYVLKLKRREFKAVVLMTSQKTLPVSVTVIAFLDAVGEEGLMTIPCIIAHMSQLFIDAYISSRWANDREEEAESKTARVAAV